MKKNSLYSFTHLITYLTIIHGLIYWFVKYFMKIETEYGLRPHHLQGFIQGTHIFLSPLLIFVFGMLFKEHIIKMYKNAIYKRKTGIALTTTMILMIISGYLIQIIYAQSIKEYTAIIHITISCLFGISYLIHHLLKR